MNQDLLNAAPDLVGTGNACQKYYLESRSGTKLQKLNYRSNLSIRRLMHDLVVLWKPIIVARSSIVHTPSLNSAPALLSGFSPRHR